MSQNYYNQPNAQYQTSTAQPITNAPQNQGMGIMSFDDPFFNMDIKEEVSDPFEHMMGRMGGFPQVGEIARRFLGDAQNMLGDMPRLADGNIPQGGALTGNQGSTSGMIAMGNLGNGTMIAKTYCKKIDYSDGQPHEESYQSQSIRQAGQDGHNISERQEAYKNTRTGVQKAANQRLLDDRGIKHIKQRNVNTGTQEEHNVLRGLRDDEVAGFNNQYNDYRQKVNFQENYKYLNQLDSMKNNVLRLGNGQGQYQPPQYGQPQALPAQNYGQTQALPAQSYTQQPTQTYTQQPQQGYNQQYGY